MAIGNGHPKRRYTDRWWYQWGRDLTTLFAVALAFWAIVINADKADQAEVRALRAETRNIVRLERVERENLQLNRATAYRLCSRDDVIRAVLHWATMAPDPDRTRAESRLLLRRLQQQDGLPILDCDTNLKGLPARVKPRAEQRAFVRRWLNGFLNRPGPKLTPAEIGICRQRFGERVTPTNC